MVKNKSSFVASALKSAQTAYKILVVLFFTTLIVTTVFIVNHPQIVKKWLDFPQTDNNSSLAELDIINGKIDNIITQSQNQNDKINFISRQFDYFEKSKADANVLVDIQNQIIGLQNITDKIGKTSNSGALILISAMLIRDNVSRGITCKKEAEALKILAENINSLNNDVDFISNNCDIAFQADTILINDFNNIYQKIIQEKQPQVPNDWKSRFLSKVGEYIKISKTKVEKNDDSTNIISSLSKINQLIRQGNFGQAIKELSLPDNNLLLQDKRIAQWYEQTARQLQFYTSISNVISNSLLIMKVEDVKSNPQQPETTME